MTDFHVDVVRLGKIEKHPNADMLEITNVHGGYPCIVRKDSFKEGDLAIYVPIETTLPDTPEFSFLSSGDRRRLKAKKLRGIFSMGLIVPIPTHITAEEGTDVAELMGITKFEPKNAPARQTGGECEADPEGWTFVKYTDIEPLRRNGNVLVEGEPVVLTEKIHGTNYRIVHDGTRLWVGSRTQIKKCPEVINDQSPVWWRIASELKLEEKLAKFPNTIIFGEVFGKGVQDLHYGASKPSFRAFDAFDLTTMRYLNFDEFVQMTEIMNIDIVPVLYKGPWNREILEPLCEGTTTFNNQHCREGFVVKPLIERWDRRVGRVILKMVGESYLLRRSC